MIDKDKLERLHIHAENMVKSAENDGMRNAGTIIQLLVSQVDDLNEEVVWLKEENESLRFDLQDKKHEQTIVSGSRSQRNGVTFDLNPRHRWLGDDAPF